MIHFLLKMVLFPGKTSSISVETSTQLCLATAFHHSLTMSPSSLGWCHLKRPVLAPVFVGVASNISKKMTNNKEDVYFIVILCYITKIAFEQSKIAFAKGKMRISVFLPSKIKPRRGVKMHAMFGFTSKCQQTNVSQNQHRTENPDISPTAKHCVFILPPNEQLWPKPPPNLTTEEPHISSHLWRDRLAQGLLPRQLAD